VVIQYLAATATGLHATSAAGKRRIRKCLFGALAVMRSVGCAVLSRLNGRVHPDFGLTDTFEAIWANTRCRSGGPGDVMNDD
jgi:hypothetical protein